MDGLFSHHSVLYTSSNTFSSSSWTPSVKGGTASEAAREAGGLTYVSGDTVLCFYALGKYLAIYTNVHTLPSTPMSGFQKNNSKKGNNYTHKAVHSNIWTRATAHA